MINKPNQDENGMSWKSILEEVVLTMIPGYQCYLAERENRSSPSALTWADYVTPVYLTLPYHKWWGFPVSGAILA